MDARTPLGDLNFSAMDQVLRGWHQCEPLGNDWLLPDDRQLEGRETITDTPLVGCSVIHSMMSLSSVVANASSRVWSLGQTASIIRFS